MESIAAEGPNAQQIEYWNEGSGARWVAMNEVIDAQIAPLGEAGIEAAAVAEGERVLDVGCGCGQTSLQLAERVGRHGEVLGIDISAVMLERAVQRAAQTGLANVRFRNADAQTERFSERFDLLFSRFGVMFFASPVEAFANLLAALRPGGRLTCVTWRPLAENPWMGLPLEAAARHLPARDEAPDPTAPGPFAFADSARVESILEEAGFVGASHERLTQTLRVGGGQTFDQTVSFVAQLGPLGAALRESEEDVRERVLQAVREALEPYRSGGDGGVRMQAGAWIVRARKSDVA